MPTVPISPYPYEPLDQMGEGEKMPNIKAMIKSLREDAATIKGYEGWRQSPNFEDRQDEPWPTVNLRRDQEELPQTKTEKAKADDAERRNPKEPPPTQLARDAGLDDIRSLTDKEVLQSIFNNEATGPDPKPRKRK